MTILPERVECERVLLREWTVDDVAEMSAVVAANLDHLRPWMPWIADEPLSPAARAELIEGWHRDRLAGGGAVFGIFLEHRAVGGCGLHRRQGPHGLEIGYWLGREHTGQGLATEAAARLTELALAVPEIDFVVIHHDKANVASGAVPARLGYRAVGESARPPEAPGEVGILCAWRTDADDWRTDAEQWRKRMGGRPASPA